jgi:hypothetical protein
MLAIPKHARAGGDHDDGRDEKRTENLLPRFRAAANGDRRGGGAGGENCGPLAMRARNRRASTFAGELDVPSAVVADALGITIRL